MKRVTSILLIGCLLTTMLLLTSCGKKENTNEIAIGCYMPLTGANAASGENQVRGLQQAIDEQNAKGGINGKTLKLITYDSAGTTEGATKAATRLIEQDQVKVIAGSFLSSSVLAVSSIAEKNKVLHVGTGTGSTWTDIGLNYTYRATSNGKFPVVTMTDELVDFGVKSIALISVISEYGQSGHDAVLQECANNSIEVLADITYQSSDTDFSGIIAKAMAAKADTIVLYGLNVELAMITKQLRQNGYNDLVFTIEGGASKEMFVVSGDAANGMVFAAPYVVPETPEEGTSDMMRSILKVYYDKYNEMPYTEIFYRGYDQGRLIIEALTKATDINSGEALAKAFKEIKGLELVGGSFDFTGGTGDGLFATNKYMILNGKYMAYDKELLLDWQSKQ